MQCTKRELAELVGRDTRTIERWEGAGMPVAVSGTTGAGKGHRYDSAAVIAWLLEREVSTEIARRVSSGDYDAQEELGRLRHHQANIAQLEEDERRGDLASISEAAQEWSLLVSNARSALLAIPVRLAQVSFGGASMIEIERAARREIEQVLKALADGADYGDPEEGAGA